jgi:hypothetical protein
MRVFILGIGATGSLLAKLLIRQGHQVACGDRDPARARGFLENHPSLSIHQVNARNLHGIVKAARGCHLLVNTCPAALNTVILRAALRLRAHYMDTASHLRQSPFRAEQLHFDRHFRRKHRIALIHAGAAPGLTNVLAIQSAAALETVDKIEIRLFEGTVSDNPVSQWCPDASFDEAVSRPPVYRNGRFLFGKRFGEREVFSFPRPIGRVGVVLAAQDEVVTLPRILRLREMDAKIGGSDTERLRRWHRQGKLNRSRGLVAARFPATLTPYVIAHLVRRGILRNARFAAAILVYGQMRARPVMVRWDATFPSLVVLCRRGLSYSPITWANAHLAAIFVKHFPRQGSGVHLPEALPTAVHRRILADVRSCGIRLTKRMTYFKTSDEADDA